MINFRIPNKREGVGKIEEKNGGNLMEMDVLNFRVVSTLLMKTSQILYKIIKNPK